MRKIVPFSLYLSYGFQKTLPKAGNLKRLNLGKFFPKNFMWSVLGSRNPKINHRIYDHAFDYAVQDISGAVLILDRPDHPGT